MANRKSKTWPARVREAIERWHECVAAWQRIFPRVIHRIDGTRYLNVKMPQEMTADERLAEGWKEMPGWRPGPNGKQIGRTPTNADDAREMGWEPAPCWSRGPTPHTRAALEVVAATQALIAIASSPRVAIGVLPLQWFRDAMKDLGPRLEQLDLFRDAKHVAEQIELRYPTGKATGLPKLTSIHWKVVEALEPFGASGALLGSIKVTGRTGKTLQRLLHDLEAHKVVELIDGGRKWRVIGQSSVV